MWAQQTFLLLLQSYWWKNIIGFDYHRHTWLVVVVFLVFPVLSLMFFILQLFWLVSYLCIFLYFDVYEEPVFFNFSDLEQIEFNFKLTCMFIRESINTQDWLWNVNLCKMKSFEDHFSVVCHNEDTHNWWHKIFV